MIESGPICVENLSMAPHDPADHHRHTNDEDNLVRANLALVHYAVNEMIARLPRHISRDELVSAALLGLAQAARSYNADRGVSFEHFARSRIRGALLDELRDRDWASRSVRANARHLQRVTDDLTNELGRLPEPQEIESRLGLSAGDMNKLCDDVHRSTVLHYDALFLESDHSEAIADREAGPTQILEDRETRGYLADAIVALPERLRVVVVGYFFDERPMQHIADELGVTESRISQMRAEALVLLREAMEQIDTAAPVEKREETGRVARHRAAYVASVAGSSDYRNRLSANPLPIPKRVAEASRQAG